MSRRAAFGSAAAAAAMLARRGCQQRRWRTVGERASCDCCGSAPGDGGGEEGESGRCSDDGRETLDDVFPPTFTAYLARLLLSGSSGERMVGGAAGSCGQRSTDALSASTAASSSSRRRRVLAGRFQATVRAGSARLVLVASFSIVVLVVLAILLRAICFLVTVQFHLGSAVLRSLAERFAPVPGAGRQRLRTSFSDDGMQPCSSRCCRAMSDRGTSFRAPPVRATLLLRHCRQRRYLLPPPPLPSFRRLQRRNGGAILALYPLGNGATSLPSGAVGALSRDLQSAAAASAAAIASADAAAGASSRFRLHRPPLPLRRRRCCPLRLMNNGNPLTREQPLGLGVYAAFAAAGVVGCAGTHAVLVPIDVVKTRKQTSPAEYGALSLVEGAAHRGEGGRRASWWDWDRPWPATRGTDSRSTRATSSSNGSSWRERSTRKWCPPPPEGARER